MLARPLLASTGEEAVRVIRALGAHRYVKAHLHLVHALAFDALAHAEAPELSDACEWARGVLADSSIEADSKDPRLLRTATPSELCAVLAGFWSASARADVAHERLLERAHGLGLDVGKSALFDEAAEDEIHPVMVDAGWELHFLSELDPVRHRGVVEAYDDPILYESARFEEENAIPKLPLLQELPALGLLELLRGVDADGELATPLVLWTEGDDVYHDYVVRGAHKAAKIGSGPVRAP
jgi:hypothetical protein